MKIIEILVSSVALSKIYLNLLLNKIVVQHKKTFYLKKTLAKMIKISKSKRNQRIGN